MLTQVKDGIEMKTKFEKGDIAHGYNVTETQSHNADVILKDTILAVFEGLKKKLCNCKGCNVCFTCKNLDKAIEEIK